MAKDMDCQNVLDELQRELNELEIGKEKMIKNNWQDLKRIRKR